MGVSENYMKNRFFIYEISPIDFWTGTFDLAGAIAQIARESIGCSDIEPKIRVLMRDYEWCKHYVESNYGSLRGGGSRIIFVPNINAGDCELWPVYIVKADNNGTTLVFSRFAISETEENLISKPERNNIFIENVHDDDEVPF